MKKGYCDLHPRVSDPFGRSGEIKDGVYIPFKFGYVNHNDVFVIPPIFDDAEEFSECIAPGHGPLAFVKFNGKTGIIKPDGTYFINPIFDAIRNFSEGFAAFKIKWDEFEGEWGYLKPDGSYLVPAVFVIAENFKNGYAKVKTSDNAKLFVQNDGSRILKSFDEIADSIINESDFDDENIVGIPFSNKNGYIDIEGRWYDEIPKLKTN